MVHAQRRGDSLRLREVKPGHDPVSLPSEEDRAKKPAGILGVRLRFVVLVLVMQVLLVRWIADSEIARGIYLICYSLMMPTVLYLLAVRVFRKWLPFDDRELLLGYIVLTATIPIVGFGGLRFVLQGMGFLRFFADSQPQWARYIPVLGSLPVLQDPEAVRSLYRGGSDVPWRTWAGPIGFWSAYLLLLSAIWICAAGILRRVWIHQERLTFPIAMLPLHLTDPHQNILRHRLLWVGFAIPAILQSLLVIHDWAPSIPAWQLKAFDVKPMLFSNPPWNAMPDFHVGFQPLAIGLAYFIPSDVSFSCWFFALLMKLSYVFGAMWGVEGSGAGPVRFPYREEQAAGAWITFACMLVWAARRHWRTVLASVPADEQSAVRKLATGAAACAGLCALMMAIAGLPMLTSVGIILVYAAYVLTGARVRAEAGAQWTFAPVAWTPNRVTGSILGSGQMGDRAFVAGGHFDLVHFDIRGQSLPYLLEGMNIAEKSGIGWRTVLVWVGIGSVSALALGWWNCLTKLHTLGAATALVDEYPMRKVNIIFKEMDRAAGGTQAWDMAGLGAMLLGGSITMLLSRLRAMGFGLLHPVGYVLCGTLTIKAFMVPFLLAWLAKTLVLRFGGNKTYRRSVPFFIGVILGDIVTQAAWSFVGWVLDVPIYQFLS